MNIHHSSMLMSAIKYLFVKNKLEIPIEFQKVMDKFLDVLSKVVVPTVIFSSVIVPSELAG